MISKEALEQIAKNGRCYSNEAREMAQELIELRAKQPQPDPNDRRDTWDFFGSFGGAPSP